MTQMVRYEIVDTIAAGDFATVYRARDRELGREVAIKQIHQQFLSDPRQLERYWREAQLLASLQHPNILTIYDLVRPRGWIVVELMRGSLQRSIERGPIDLDFLRMVLTNCLSALQFLHSNGIIHGDIKPSNMLVDAQGRIKLGDFGLARRASNEQGSLLKGATKYMAPELVSNQFGPVGPASDLYSLGFSAYELMCGPQFESLFPGLSTFGRDKQIAWLMWHAAVDRHMPEISKVLEGVPPDLAHVIQRLIQKDQNLRYHTAQEVLLDLRTGLPSMEGDLAAPPLPPPKANWRKRLAIIGAVLVSAACCTFMLMPEPPPEKVFEAPPSPVGVIRTVSAPDRSLAIDSDEDGKLKQFTFRPVDRFLLNGKEVLLDELQQGDRVTVDFTYTLKGREKSKVVNAFRSEQVEGVIKSVDADNSKFTLLYGPKEKEETITVVVPPKLRIRFNENRHPGEPLTAADLQAGDRAVLQHRENNGVREATTLAITRTIEYKGIVRGFARGELTVAEDGDDAKRVSMRFMPKPQIVINGSPTVDNKPFTPADLAPGDKVTVKHSTMIESVVAERIVGKMGVVKAVQAKALEVQMDGRNGTTSFVPEPDCKISLAGETVPLASLQANDRVDITTNDSLDAKNPRALSIVAQRPTVTTRWAVLIAVQNYEDSSLGSLRYTAADAQLIQDALVKRYSVPAGNLLLLTDPNQSRFKQGVIDVLKRTGDDASLVVYYTGHAYRGEDGAIYLAPKEFNHQQAAGSGVSLQWLVNAMESCQAKEKLLLLDACHDGSDAAREPSSSDMIRSLKPPPGQAALRTVTAISSCMSGQRGHDLPDKQHGVFAQAVGDGYSGLADKNRDNRIEITELFTHLTESMRTAASTTKQPQTPQIFLPDNRPPRLNADAKNALRALAARLKARPVDPAAAKVDFNTARKLCGKELEPLLLMGLIDMKSTNPKFKQEALRGFEQIKTARSSELLPRKALSWLKAANQQTQAVAIDELAGLISTIPVPSKPGEVYSAEAQPAFLWAGKLAEFAAGVAENKDVAERNLAKLDEAIKAHHPKAKEFYYQGRDQSRAKLRDFDEKIKGASEVDQARLRLDRRQLGNYAEFPYDQEVQTLLGGMDQ